MGFNPMRDRSFRDVRQAHQPAASAHDRRHDGASVQGEGAEGLRPARQNLCGLPRPVARYGDEGGPSPLSVASGAAADQPGFDQRRRRRASVLLHRDARTARPRSSSDDREQAAQGAGRAQPGRGGAPARSRAGPEVQGRAQRRLRRGPARVRGRAPEGVRHRQPAHDASGRAGQRAAGSLCDAVAATARTLARMVAGGAAAGLAVPRPKPGQPDHRPSAQSRRHRRQDPGGDIQARVAAYAAAQLRHAICSSRTSIFG